MQRKDRKQSVLCCGGGDTTRQESFFHTAKPYSKTKRPQALGQVRRCHHHTVDAIAGDAPPLDTFMPKIRIYPAASVFITVVWSLPELEPASCDSRPDLAVALARSLINGPPPIQAPPAEK